MKRMSFSKKIARVFDDNLKTRQWENIIDYTIIGLIVISSIEVFLSTFPDISDKYGHILHFVDVFTTIVFTIEVTLRIWFADVVDEKYKGFKGRLKYCFSFYGMIDILSTYPFYLNYIMPVPYNALKILRIARLFRVFRYMKSFRSPIYWAKAHTIGYTPLSYTSGCAVCSTKKSINESIMVVIAKN